MSTQEDEEQARFVDRRAASAGEAAPEGASAAAGDEPLEAQLAAEKERAQSYLGSWQRAAADYQNFKRRVEQEREEVARLASAAFIINLLPVIDDLERALQSVDAHLVGLTWVDGVRLIHRKFVSLLELSDVEEIAAEGEAFDPTLHEAVMFGEGEEGKVLSVVQRGFKLGGRVLRPTMVVVGGKAPQD